MIPIRGMMMRWHNNVRCVKMTEDFHGLVEIEIAVNSDPGYRVGHIWNLYVDEGYRGRGYAGRLLDAAEEWLSLQGCNEAELEWDKRDTPVEILEWYKKRGYEESCFNENIVKLVKKITPWMSGS